jgi:hypothetical protein
MPPRKSNANRVESRQYYPAPEVPDGMERSFPFFLDSRDPVESQIAIENEPSMMGIDLMELDYMDNTESNCSPPHISSCRFNGGIPISELCIEAVSLHFNQIGISSCTAELEDVPSSNRAEYRQGNSRFQTKSINKLSAMSIKNSYRKVHSCSIPVFVESTALAQVI